MGASHQRGCGVLFDTKYMEETKGERDEVSGAMKKILMVCNYFAPDAAIAAIRTTKLAKYVKEHGYEVTFLAEKKSQGGIDEILSQDATGIKVVYAENSQAFMKFHRKYKKWIKPHKDKRLADLTDRRRVNRKTGHIEFYPFETAYPLIGSLDYVVEWMRQRDLFKCVRDFLRGAEEYDYLLTSYGDAFSWFCGLYFKKCHRNVPWHFDIRDAVWRYKFTPDYIKFIPKRMEKKAWKNADVITGVSRAICGRVPERYQSKVYLLTNGYDRADCRDIGTRHLDVGKIHFTYTGSMYGGLQDLTYFFKAVGDLVSGKKIDKERLEFHYAGNEPAFGIFKSQAAACGLEGQCRCDGKLERRQALELQRSSDILLLASYDYEDNTGGIITGKVYEYMMAGRPVICVVTGDIKKSEIGEIIRKTGIGFVYEESHHTEDFGKLEEYILMQYEKKMGGRPLLYEPDAEELDKYSYESIGKKLIEIIGKG